MYLVDTNVWLELLLGQERAQAVRYFLGTVESGSLFITDFGFHSIGIVLTKLNNMEALLHFVQDTLHTNTWRHRNTDSPSSASILTLIGRRKAVRHLISMSHEP